MYNDESLQPCLRNLAEASRPWREARGGRFAEGFDSSLECRVPGLNKLQGLGCSVPGLRLTGLLENVENQEDGRLYCRSFIRMTRGFGWGMAGSIGLQCSAESVALHSRSLQSPRCTPKPCESLQEPEAKPAQRYTESLGELRQTKSSKYEAVLNHGRFGILLVIGCRVEIRLL